MDGRMMLGVNVGVIALLTIFTGFLVLPFRLLLDANHEVQRNTSTNTTARIEEVIEFRKLRLCSAGYKYWVASTFMSNYDRNCTYEGSQRSSNDASDNGKSNGSNLPSGFRVIRPKSVPVTDHILALMLIVSVIGAFVELLRLRFINPEDTRGDGVTSRRQSIVDLMLPRRCISREPIKPQMSLDMQRMHRSPLRMLVTFQPRRRQVAFRR
ncbi:uncharacterized protein LOC107044305 isoform X2 [Diachasma alloeum]|uniref:uncharacterized protein LOC107044305 isoform X2 n=1 Tax=Diachasma alloeum TaxID=454923 RepID=UPI0007383AC8|nr:uncharacterized protein LOC107044305 isoform X2 [Diachasma alloeum]